MWGLLVFLALAVATFLLMRNFLKQMRKTEEARRKGVFGEVDDEEAREQPH